MKKSTLGLLAGVLGSAVAFWVNQRIGYRWLAAVPSRPVPHRNQTEPANPDFADGII